MTDVLIHSPFSQQSSQGNSVTADRLNTILQEARLNVLMETERYSGVAARCLIALNARRSARAVADFKANQSDSKIIVILTGTDINHPEVKQENSPTSQTMEMAHHLVLLHDASLAAVPERFHAKCSVIYPSVTMPESLQHVPEGKNFTIVMAGNMREEKNPELAAGVSSVLPDGLEIHVYGEYSESSPSSLIKHGMVPHGEMLCAMSKAHVLLNTSVQEGGANAVCEAISLGLPVVASAIPGNIGMLGEDYAGLFASNEIKELVSLLTQIASDPEFYSHLKRQVSARAPLFEYAHEAVAWTDLLRSQLSH